MMFFNKPCEYSDYQNWDKPDFINFELVEYIWVSEMTDQEKLDNPSHKTTGGYNKPIEYKEAYINSWNKADKVDRLKIKNAPNFDADIFFEISGIKVDEDDEKDQKKKVILDQIKELTAQTELLRKQAEDL